VLAFRLLFSVPSNEERLDLCKKALEEKETVDQIIMQGVFVGFPRSGKTSTKKRLMGKRPNRQQASTGVAEKASRVEIEKTTVQSLSPANWHEIDDLDEETAVITDDIDNFESQKEKARMNFIKCMKDKGDSFTVQTSEVQTQPNKDTAKYSEFNPATISGYLKDVETAIRKFEKKFHTRMKPWTIYLKDTGGQPEFQELLPALVSGPSLYFLFFRLDQDLNKKYLVQYQHPTSGRLIEPFEASFTMKEALLQFLASIASTRSYTKIEDKAPILPKVLFIGTHKDRLRSKRLLKKIDQELQQAVCKTDAFKEGMIEFATKDNLILAIDNFSEGEEDVQSIRDVVERIGVRGEVYSVQTPYSWLLFSIILRKQHKRILSLDTCMEIAKKCRIDTLEELQNALWFLHHNTGVVRYFQNVLTLKDVVIVDPQYIFDKLTELIVNTLTFEEIGKPQYDEFIKKGIFSCDVLQKLTTESDGLDGEKFKALLEYLHIVAPIEEGGKTIKYFAPCALTHAKIAPPISLSKCKIPSILLTFGSGYCPKGIFGSLVVKLLDKDKCSEFEWALEEDHIYRDQLSLSVGPFDSFQFRVSATFIQVDLIDSLSPPSRSVSLEAVCYDVRHCIEKSIEFVSKKLHYTHKAAHSLAFLCPGPHNDITMADVHPAVINTHNGKICSITCTRTNKKLLLPNGYNVWFNDSEVTTEERSLSISSIPKLHELDRIEGDGKVVKVIETVASTWNKIALRLHFSHHDISRINQDNREQSVPAMSAVFTEWLAGKGRKPTNWETLITALKESDYLIVASDLQVIFGVDYDSVVSDDTNVLQEPSGGQRFKCTLL
jgi:GTPase SAR1 family protein